MGLVTLMAVRPWNQKESRLVLPSLTAIPTPDRLLPPGFIWTEAHDYALELYIGERSTYAAFEFFVERPRTEREVLDYFEAHNFNDLFWNAHVTELYQRDLLDIVLVADSSWPKGIVTSDYGHVVYRALLEIPEAVKEYAMCWNWTRVVCPGWVYPLPAFATEMD